MSDEIVDKAKAVVKAVLVKIVSDIIYRDNNKLIHKKAGEIVSLPADVYAQFATGQKSPVIKHIV